MSTHRFDLGRTPGEAVFVPADEQASGSGRLMTFVYDAASERSDLVVLGRALVATVHLPRRIPFGFHGNRLPDL